MAATSYSGAVAVTDTVTAAQSIPSGCNEMALYNYGSNAVFVRIDGAAAWGTGAYIAAGAARVYDGSQPGGIGTTWTAICNTGETSNVSAEYLNPDNL